MNDKQKRSMLIHFNDGSNRLFEFPAPVADSDANLAALQLSPAPTKLPAYAIKGASFRD